MKTLQMRPGQHGYSADPVIGITCEGRLTYLWIGNNQKDDMRCYATLSGPKRLEAFAHAILKAINERRRTAPTSR